MRGNDYIYIPLKKLFWITYAEWKFHFDNIIKPTFGKHMPGTQF